MPAGIGVDAPLWWSSGKGGLRKADQWIRRQYGLHPRNVQAVNSLWGSVLAQGMMFVTRIREVFPSVNISETHPKAVLVALGREPSKVHLASIRTMVTLDSKPDHERDAIISAVAAREGFEGRWKRDLAVDRFPSEQNRILALARTRSLLLACLDRGPTRRGAAAADRRGVAARDQARRLPRRRPQGRRPRAALQPSRQRPDLPLHADRRVARPAALALLHHRRRGGVLRRQRAGRASTASATAARTTGSSCTPST